MIVNFLIACSGANKDILKLCPTERTKFANIGAIILLTALMAGLSGGYAIYFTFNNAWVAVCFGIFWAVVIFNLDRYIVSSIRKSGNRKQELLTASPRFFIALVLAVTISKPLEIKLFDGTISKRLGVIEDSYNKTCDSGFNQQRNMLEAKVRDLRTQLESRKLAIYQGDPIFKDYEGRVSAALTANTNLTGQIDDNAKIITKNSWQVDVPNPETGEVKKAWRSNETAKSKSIENRGLRKEIADNKKLIGEWQASMNSRKGELTDQVKKVEEQYNEQLAGVQTQINDMNARRSDILQKCRADAAKDRDILARLRALGDLKQWGNSIWWASLLITILFILIETSPVTVKLLAKRGPYDEVLDRIEYEVKCEQEKLMNAKKKEVETMEEEIDALGKLKMELRVKTQKAKIEAELSLNESLLKDISDKTALLVKEEVRKWYEKHMPPANGKANGQHAAMDEDPTTLSTTV